MKFYFYTFLFILLIHLAYSQTKIQENSTKQRILQNQLNSQQSYENNTQKVQIIQNNPNNETVHQQQFQCPCMNDGVCYTLENHISDFQNHSNVFCKCPQDFIGTYCEQKAIFMPVNIDIFQLIINTKYKYFYYQPERQNAYSFSFNICFSQTDQQLINSKINDSDQLQKQITFFFTLQNINGTIELNETQNQPETIVLERDQCKHIYADYTPFFYTQTHQIQKLILAVKLGHRLYDTTNMSVYTNSDDTNKKKNNLKYQSDTKQMDKDSSKLKYKIDSPNANKKYTKEYLQKQLNSNTTRLIYIDFNIFPFTIEEFFQNILYSLATIVCFVLIAILLFILRTKILGLNLIYSFNAAHGLENDLQHFQKYMPPESFRLENRSNADLIIDVQDQQQCIICLKIFTDGEQIRRTPCDHLFHKQCIDSWCLQNLTCPICRKSFTQKNLKQLDQPSLLQIRTNSDSND